jgi:hypothetical protein
LASVAGGRFSPVGIIANPGVPPQRAHLTSLCHRARECGTTGETLPRSVLRACVEWFRSNFQEIKENLSITIS